MDYQREIWLTHLKRLDNDKVPPNRLHALCYKPKQDLKKMVVISEHVSA